MNIEITIRAPELAAALVALSEALAKPLELINAGATTEVLEKVEVPEKKAKTAKAVTTTTTPSTKKEEASTISLSQIRAKFVEAAQKGKREELKALLQDYDADNVSSLNAEVFEEVYARLEAM